MSTLAEQIEAIRIGPTGTIPVFKRILVHVDRDKKSDHRIETGLELAKRFAGKVAGVYVARPFLPMAFMVGPLPPAIIADQQQVDQEEAETAKRRFLDHVVRRGMDSEWHYIREAPVPILRRLARYMDLSVVGQPDPETPDEQVAVRPEELALGSGRPVLVVPYIGGALNPGQRIVIAWDGSREAARAVADAMPLLVQAGAVWVLSIGAKTAGITDQSSAPEDLRRFLADHGIASKSENLQTDETSEADALLSRIADFGADLLVMGCYGHTRVRELVLGGMTREILRHMTVPVLMSH